MDESDIGSQLETELSKENPHVKEGKAQTLSSSTSARRPGDVHRSSTAEMPTTPQLRASLEAILGSGERCRSETNDGREQIP